ncbi:hypothetical protein NFIA_056480 [Paecilomyces variotii No. 5]|uniref:Uncharacterized protein n=1 Tax=Byssochlamys spectabilis (strain No. 5 / NBRC 109023) TaxID=1356009 RepID=V5G1M1_BYSSN|nr:hypothetical protein NFIA_056480 [Paecilomyces variotii No. 5]
MSGSQEPSLLDYARFHGIAIDHQAIAPLDQVPPPHGSVNDDFTDPPGTPSIDPVAVRRSLEQELKSEKLDIPKDAARFLSSLLRTASGKSLDVDWDSICPGAHPNRNLKLEVPLLKRHCEPSTSLSRAERIALDPVKLQLPRESVSDEEDEGLVFPKQYYDLSDSIKKGLSTERLDCSKDDLESLQRIRRIEKPDSRSILEEICESQRERNGQYLRDLSPILLPRRTYASMHVNSHLASTVSSLSSPEIITGNMHTVKDPHSEEYGTTGRSCSDNGVMRSETEEPTGPGSRIHSDELTHTDEVGDNNTEVHSVPFIVEHDYEETDYVYPTPQHNVQCPYTDDLLSDPNTAGGMLDGYIGELSTHCFESLTPTNEFPDDDVPEQKTETGDPADTNIASKPFISRTKNQTKPHDSKYLSFPEVSKSDSQGLLLSDPSRPAVIISGSDFPSSKCAGLAAQMPSTPMICTEKSPEKVDSLENTPEIDRGSNSEIQIENPARVKKQIKKIRHVKPPKHTQQADDLDRSKVAESLSASTFSALGSLASFMKIRGVTSKRRKTEQSRFFPAEVSQNGVLINSDLTKRPREDCTSRRAYEKLDITILDTPSSALVTHSLILVLSTSFLRMHRHIVRALESLTAAPTLVFRDYEGHGHQEACISVGNASNVLLEADIILSPTAGIIVTTTQATTQLYLPGHKRQVSDDGFPPFDSPLRERIARLSLRYDHIYLFICHAPSHTMDSSAESSTLTVDPKVLSSVQSLIAFCASLYSLENPKEPDIGSMSTRKAIYQSVFKTSQDETSWEVFLRRAGLNPFAALAVLEFINRQELLEDGGVSDSIEEWHFEEYGINF